MSTRTPIRLPPTGPWFAKYSFERTSKGEMMGYCLVKDSADMQGNTIAQIPYGTDDERIAIADMLSAAPDLYKVAYEGIENLLCHPHRECNMSTISWAWFKKTCIALEKAGCSDNRVLAVASGKLDNPA